MASICAAVGVAHGASCPTSTTHELSAISEATAREQDFAMRHYRVKRCSLHFFQALDDVFDPRLWANYPQPGFDQMDATDATGPDA